MGPKNSKQLGSDRAPTPAPDSVWEREAKSLSRLPLYLVAGVLAITGIVVMANGDEEKPPADEAASAAVETAEPAGADSSEERTDPPPAETLAKADDEPPPPEPEETDSILAAGTAPTESDPDQPSSAHRDPTPNTGGANGGSKKAWRRAAEKSEPPKPVQPAPDPGVEIEAALKAGWMREFGSLLLVFPRNTPMGWDSAKSLCQRRREAGFTNWRLVRFAELKRLQASRAVPAGTWWSSTATEDGNHVLVISPGKASEISKADGKALPLCVHARPAS